MNSEFLAQLDYLGQERGISREVLLDSLEKAIATAARKDPMNPPMIEIKINPQTGEISAFAEMEVVETLPGSGQISLEDAKKIKPEASVSDKITMEIKHRDLGRIAAQTARQVMLQQLRKAEKAIVQQEFMEKLNQIVSGTVRRIESGNIIVDMQKAEGILKREDQIPGERYSQGDRINAIITEIESKGAGPSLILSRSSVEFVRRLFEREVTEIHNGIVQIKGIAREPGSRTKIAVASSDSHIDPIGACVGIRGMRVKNITNELSGEKIDIIKYDEGIKNFVINALQPAVIKDIEINENAKSLIVKVQSDQFALTLGRKGQNLRLTSRLTGWKMDILEVKDDRTSFEEKLEQTVISLAEHLGIDVEIARKLVSSGYLTIEGLLAGELSDIQKIEDLGKEEAELVVDAIKKIKKP